MFPLCALTYLLAMLASNEALQHVSYPTQVIGKSIKPVPVMLFGVFIAGKRYPMMKYLAILMVVLGCFNEFYKLNRLKNENSVLFLNRNRSLYDKRFKAKRAFGRPAAKPSVCSDWYWRSFAFVLVGHGWIHGRYSR